MSQFKDEMNNLVNEDMSIEMSDSRININNIQEERININPNTMSNNNNLSSTLTNPTIDNSIISNNPNLPQNSPEIIQEISLPFSFMSKIGTESKYQKIFFAIFVNGLIIAAALVNTFLLRYNYLEKEAIESQLYFAIILVSLIVANYFICSFTSAETTNVNKYFDLTSTDQIVNKGISIINIDPLKYPSKCEFCNKIKFERSSHCRTCKICVLRRDHHCIWIGNCVGLHNNQYFFNFCFWVVVKKYFINIFI